MLRLLRCLDITRGAARSAWRVARTIALAASSFIGRATLAAACLAPLIEVPAPAVQHIAVGAALAHALPPFTLSIIAMIRMA